MPNYSAITSAAGGSNPDEMRRRRGRSPKGGGGNASMLSSNINLLNTIVGAGTLAMPAAMSHMGVLLGTLVIVWSGVTSAFGLYLQSRCARYLDRGHSSFFALSQITYPNAAVFFDTAIAIKCFGVGVSYLIIIGDLMPGVVVAFLTGGGGSSGEESLPAFLLDRNFWITAFMLAIIPLAFLRRLDSLKYTSVIALVSIGYLIVLVVYHYTAADVPGPGERGVVHYVAWSGPVAMLSSLPVVIFAYTCHQNMFSVLNEIKDNSPASIVGVIGASIGSAASIYLLVAITGYLTFGDKVVGNIVSMYPANFASTVGKAAIVVLVTFSVPLQIHPCRASLDAVLKWRPNKTRGGLIIGSGSGGVLAPSVSSLGSGGSGVGSNGGSSNHQALLPTVSPAAAQAMDSHGMPVMAMSDLRFALLTTAIVIASYMTALSVSSLDRVLAYVGSTGSTSISFILPGLFYYKISDPDSIHHQRLAKEDDDVAAGGIGDDGYESDGLTDDETELNAGETSLLSGAPVPSVGPSNAAAEAIRQHLEERRQRRRQRRQKGKWWRWDLEHVEHGLLRKMALCLAGYGVVVMIVCLGMNTFFVPSGH